MSEMKIENHFAQGAIVNNGQMNVGGGTIHVHVQGKEHVVEEQAENATCNPQPDKKSTPKPLPADAAPNPAWQAIVRDNAGKRCTFVAPAS